MSAWTFAPTSDVSKRWRQAATIALYLLVGAMVGAWLMSLYLLFRGVGP